MNAPYLPESAEAADRAHARGPRALHAHFLEILPRVETHARIHFRHLRCPGRRDDAVAETVAVAWKWFLRLARAGARTSASSSRPWPTTPSGTSARGRRLCGQERAKDAMSPVAQRRHGFGVEALAPPHRCREALYAAPHGQDHQDAFEERLRDDTRSPVPEQAAFRIDYPAWLSRLGERDRAIVGDMTLDLGTTEFAARHAVSPGRISQTPPRAAPRLAGLPRRAGLPVSPCSQPHYATTVPPCLCGPLRRCRPARGGVVLPCRWRLVYPPARPPGRPVLRVPPRRASDARIATTPRPSRRRGRGVVRSVPDPNTPECPMKLHETAACPVREKFVTTRKELSAALIERDGEVDIVLTALVCNEHPLLVGSPGTAKSLLLDSLMAWTSGRRFTALLTKFTTPDELFGPISVRGLKEDKYRRVTDRQDARGPPGLPRRGLQGVVRDPEYAPRESIREATDFLGLGVEVGGGAGTIGHVAYAPPRWAIEAAQAPRALVLFDELTTCPASVRKAMLRVMQERYAGDLKLPDTVAILAAANPPETAVDGYDLEPPTANRMIHLDFDFPADTWLDGLAAGFDHLHQPSIVELIGNGDDNHRATIRGAVTAFLRARRDLLDTDVPTDPTIAGRAWPSRRSWTNAITALAEVQAGDVEAQHLVLAGAVGEGPAREFFTFRAALDLPTPEEAIAQADTIRWAGMRPDQVYAVTTSLRAYVINGRHDQTTWLGALHTLTKIADAGLPDVAQSAVTALLLARPHGAAIPADLRNAFADLFVGIGRWAA